MCVNNPRNIVEEPFDSDSVVVHDLLVPFNIIYVPVAQLVEHSTFNRVVGGSSPLRHTNGLIAKTVYAVD